MDILTRDVSRRTFVCGLSAAAFLAAHDALCSAPVRGQPEPGPTPKPARIRGVRLLTAAPLESMRGFYRDRLGFRVIEERESEITFAAGATRLTFVNAPGAPGGGGPTGPAPAPFYHFAFNIPEHKVLAARAWQLERSPLVPTPPGLRDPAFPDDVRHFRHWNAHSLFFFDAAHNIVEYIARHALKGDATGGGAGFDTADILYASEIGYMVRDPDRAARSLHKTLGLSPYPSPSDTWWAMGDERGLVLCLPIGRVFGENTATPKTFAIFQTESTISRGMLPASHASGAPALHEFEGYPYKLRVE